MPAKPEEMGCFFNARADGYDEHMCNSIVSFDRFYKCIVDPLSETSEIIEILDIGAGTGLELEHIFRKAPNSRITVIDISSKMLAKLQVKFESRSSQIKIVVESYLTAAFPHANFDYAVSVMSLQHLEFDEKVTLYKKVYDSLNLSGLYIEGDYIVSEEEEKRLLAEYRTTMRKNDLSDKNLYHIDIPFSTVTQAEALRMAGFKNVEIIFSTINSNIIMAKKQ